MTRMPACDRRGTSGEARAAIRPARGRWISHERERAGFTPASEQPPAVSTQFRDAADAGGAELIEKGSVKERAVRYDTERKKGGDVEWAMPVGIQRPRRPSLQPFAYETI